MEENIYLAAHPLGKGIYAKRRLAPGELVLSYEGRPGEFVDGREAAKLYQDGFDYFLQVGPDLFFAAVVEAQLEAVDFMNHSCDPNCGVRKRLEVVAMREILQDEEVTIDYAMTESWSYKMACKCGTEKCRVEITGQDWKNAEIQMRYQGYFSDYLQKRMK